jgi:hypothetical protein
MGLKINFSKLGINFDLRLGWFNTGFYVRQYLGGVVHAVGIRNNCYDGSRVIFLDYDNILYTEMLIPEIKYLQEKYSLGDFYIFKSSQKEHSYHAICLDKVKVYEWRDILNDSSCDENYKKPALKDFKTCVLRVSKKGSSDAPRYISTIKPIFESIRERSLAHGSFLHFHYNCPINLEKGLWDTSDNLIYVKYGTLNYLKKDGENCARH